LIVVAYRQRVVEEMLARAFAYINKLGDRKARERVARRLLVEQVAAHKTAVCLAYLDKRLARAMMRDARDVETPVGLAFSQDRYVKHKFGFQI
jgi:hypothetical protein